MRFTALGLVLALAGCSDAASDGETGVDGSAGSAASAGSAGSSAKPGQAGAGGGSAETQRYPDAPDAAEPKPWNAPVLEPVISAGPDDDWHARDNAALEAFSRMYSAQNGTWNAGYRWTFANDVEAVESSYLRTGGENHWDMVLGTYEKQKADNFLKDGGYDDQLWWGHAWLLAYELTGDKTYLEMVKVIFADTTKGWEPAVCDGGVWWQKRAVYKNAITNELFLLLAASLHNHVPGDSGPGSYIEWAHKAWKWFSESGLINSSKLINDGLSDACENNQQTTWTYNQGVILGALVEMYKATGDASYLTQAEQLADASTQLLADQNGILQESCEPSACDHDQVSFKGLYIRNLAHLYDWTHKASYYDFIVKNARSAFRNARDNLNRFGTDWGGPFDASSSTRQSSAMFALSALADKYSPASLFVRPSAGPTFGHNIGQRASLLAWACDLSTCPSAGFMQFGPYVSYLPLGTHTAHVRLTVDKASSSEDALVTIDVYDGTANKTLATRDVTWKEFLEPNVSQDFAITYTQNTAGNPLEYRVRWNATPGAPRVVVSDVSVDGEQSFSAANLEHECGRLDASFHWAADRFRDPKACYLTHGPGVRLEDGEYVAHFELKLDDFAIDDVAIAKISVVNREEGKVIASAEITRQKFPNALFTTFALPFRAFAGRHYEFRTEWLAAPSAPRLTERAVHLRKATVETTVALPFNSRGMAAKPGDANLDGASSALNLALLGPRLDIHYHPFALGGSGNNVLEASNSEVSVPEGSYRSLELLGFAVKGTQVNQPFTISYADGSSQTITRSISDWLAFAPQPDERIARNLPYRWSATAAVYGNFHVFHYSLPLNPEKRLRAFKLPGNVNVKILAATLSAAK